MEGMGFATGTPNRVEVTWRSDGRRWLGLRGGPARSIADLPVHAQGRCSRILEIGPLEHIAAGLGIAGWEGWGIECEHPDIPLLDGSAMPWFASAANLRRGPVPARPFPFLEEEMEIRGTHHGRILARPATSFRLECRWSDGPGGIEVWEGGLGDLESLAAARTFIGVRDFLHVRRHGAMKGVDPRSGRLLGPAHGEDSEDLRDLARELGVDPRSPVWAGGEPRMASECAAHKALDLVGDILLWLGYLPHLHLVAQDSGHTLHHLFGRELRALAEPHGIEPPCP